MSTDIAVRHATLTEKIQYAKAMADSSLLPRHYQKQPANLLIALEYAEAFGISPINAISSVYVIDGKPSASADLIAALVRKAGHTLRVSGDDTTATAEIIRADDPDFTFTASWDMDKARKAGLTNKSTWKNYPGALLRARAITEVARMGASDALFGVIYTPEEIGAEVQEDGTPLPGEVVDAVEASGRDWVDEANRSKHVALLRALRGECKAWGELTQELEAHFIACAEAVESAAAPAAEPVESPEAVEEQPALDGSDPWTTEAKS